MAFDPHQPLRDDVRLLGELLGQVLREHEGEELFVRVEEVREASKRARTGDIDLDAVAAHLREMPIPVSLTVARAFAHFLNLANIAEQHHRIRRRRQYARDPEGTPQRGSCEETLARLRDGGIGTGLLRAAALDLHIDLVLTAHPTEIARRTLLQKHNAIADVLAYRDRTDLTPEEREQALDRLHQEIAAAWQTDEVRRTPVTPLDEVRAGLVMFEQTLWQALPQYLRGLSRALEEVTGEPLPLEATPVRFGSWIGGDRDGNPNITAEITRQATWLARWQAADLYLREIAALRSELSLTTASEELRARVGDAREPYRVLLAEVRDRLVATRAWAEASLDGEPASPPPHRPYLSAAELAEPIDLCRRSLLATGNRALAGGRIADIVRRIAAFGTTLARLDLRQEASRHTDAIDWIFASLGTSGYASRTESERRKMLVDALERQIVTLDELPLHTATSDVREVLDTFRMAARLHPESLGAYIISMATDASDVLAVELLQAAASNRHPQRVVPLFETGRELERAGSVLRDLLAMPWYRNRIDGRQEVMVGYSDSAKDVGRLSANWALYRAQEELVAAAERAGVHLTLFHGRGGSIGRGGGPTYLAIQAQPPGSIKGTLRATEQGEMIQAKFGLVDIAIRTLDVYTTATLEATVAPQPQPRDQWRTLMDELAAAARRRYRAVVYEDERFPPYFAAATPIPELARVHIGSRPARRKSAAGVEHLRAISWQFAWTQTRLMLPSWLGYEEALMSGDVEQLREMYRQWGFFTSSIDLVEMTLAKADRRIACHYDRLVAGEMRPFGAELRESLERAIAAVLAVTGHETLLENNPVLRRSIDVRNPYVDPINLAQVELLSRLRGGDPDPALFDAFVVTVNGIAAGMRNTG